MRRLAPPLLCVIVLALTGCTGHTARGTPTTTTRPRASAIPTVAPTPTPSPLPPYAIETLRKRPYATGRVEVGAELAGGQGYTKRELRWPSGGQTMTGTISLPDSPGPHPVVVVNHGYIPPDRYWVGQDSGIFGDPMAAHGFISVAPNWPGYAGSGAAPPDLPSIVGEVVTMLDLVSELSSSMPDADVSRLACVGHSNGSGICMLAMVVDPRFRAVVLHGPISSDMADNARKWWMQNGGSQAAGAGSPDQDPEGYRLLSPRNYFARGQPPVLIIHGDADQTCPLEWAQATLAALQAQGVESRLVSFPGAQHDFAGADLQRAVAIQEDWIRHALGM